MSDLALVCFRQFLLLMGVFGWLWEVLGGCDLLVVLANFRWLWEVVVYFD